MLLFFSVSLEITLNSALFSSKGNRFLFKFIYFFSESHYDCIVKCIFVYYYVNGNMNEHVYTENRTFDNMSTLTIFRGEGVPGYYIISMVLSFHTIRKLIKKYTLSPDSVQTSSPSHILQCSVHKENYQYKPMTRPLPLTLFFKI